MVDNPLDRAFREGCGEWDRYGADLHGTEQCEYPVRNVFHQNADAIAVADAFCCESRGCACSLVQDIAIAVLLNVVLAIQDECHSIRRPARPSRYLLRYPSGRKRISNCRACGLYQKGHNTLISYAA